MATVLINRHKQTIAVYDFELGRFVCAHLQAEVEPPCCSTAGSSSYIECGCQGVPRVYCPDCKGKDLSDQQIKDLLEGYYDCN